MWLVPLLSADLERGFLDLLVASDASTSFGYGVSYAKIGSAAVHKISRFAVQRGDFVTLTGDDNSVTWSHQGKAHQLPVSLDDFRDVLSVEAREVSHSGAMEGLPL